MHGTKIVADEHMEKRLWRNAYFQDLNPASGHVLEQNKLNPHIRLTSL